MARHRRPRTLLVAVAALVTSWLTVIGGATAAPAAQPATAAAGGSEQTAAEASPLVAVPAGTYRIRNRDFRGLCLAAGPYTDPQIGDTAVYTGSCTEPYALWTLGPTDPAHGSQYMEVRSAAYNTRCLDADNRGGRLTGIIHLYTCNRSPNQAWDFRGGTSHGQYACVAVASLCDLLLEQYGAHNTGFGGPRVRLGNRYTGGVDWQEYWLLERVS